MSYMILIGRQVIHGFNTVAVQLKTQYKMLFQLLLGWYTAEIQSVDHEDDEVDVVYLEEPACVYTIPVLPNLASGRLRIKEPLF